MASNENLSNRYFLMLNATSSADADFVQPIKLIQNRRSTYWKVERLVERRETDETVSVWPQCLSSHVITCVYIFLTEFSGNQHRLFFAFHLIKQNTWCNGRATCLTKPRGSQRRVSYLDARNYSTDVAIIPENVCSFRVAVERHLKSRSLLPARLFFRECFPFLVRW